MFESNLKIVNDDLKVLVKDAQVLFQEAATVTGDKADELRNKGMGMLDAAIEKAHSAQNCAMATGKKMAESSNNYVKENPWYVVVAAVTVGVLAGLVMRHKTGE